ncbi:hypothetical protein F4780DRAFT_578637 [Xylariomycetidae sp. FL0641]|nr:hypothetical protein F4780DRAFT_578637 [Xylariomycetidae sp. FL0641]
MRMLAARVVTFFLFPTPSSQTRGSTSELAHDAYCGKRSQDSRGFQPDQYAAAFIPRLLLFRALFYTGQQLSRWTGSG